MKVTNVRLASVRQYEDECEFERATRDKKTEVGTRDKVLAILFIVMYIVLAGICGSIERGTL